MERLIQASLIFDKIYPVVKHIKDKTIFTCFLGTLIDQWTADNDLEPEAGVEILKQLSSVMSQIHEAEGAMPKSDTTAK